VGLPWASSLNPRPDSDQNLAVAPSNRSRTHRLGARQPSQAHSPPQCPPGGHSSRLGPLRAGIYFTGRGGVQLGKMRVETCLLGKEVISPYVGLENRGQWYRRQESTYSLYKHVGGEYRRNVSHFVSTDGTVRVEFEREWKTRYVRGSQTSRLRLEASARQRV
jgi:hypothetical protein